MPKYFAIRHLLTALFLRRQMATERTVTPQLITLGGWCGPVMFLREKVPHHGASLPFDAVRSTFSGVIRLIAHDFLDFLPNREDKDIVRRDRGNTYHGDIIFVHHDPFDSTTRDTFNRRIDRIKSVLSTTQEVIFLRAVIHSDPKVELSQVPLLREVLRVKYPHLNWRIIFFLHGQGNPSPFSVFTEDRQVSIWAVPGLHHDLLLLYKSYQKILEMSMVPWTPNGIRISNFLPYHELDMFSHGIG